VRIPDKVRARLDELPDAPGCYLMRDGRGRIIYVGKAVSLRKRVRSYFRQAALRRGSPRLRSLVNSVDDIDHVVTRSETEAILVEGRLLKEYRPRFNVSFTDDKRFLLLAADPREPLPRFAFSRIRREDGRLYFGPYASAAAARATLDFAAKTFGLRECAPRAPDAETYRRCLNDIIRYCSAPCVARVTEEEYRRRFDEACAFLRGRRPAVTDAVAAAMREASAAMDFERAAALRDTLLYLRAALRRQGVSEKSPDMRKEEALAGVRALQASLGLAGPPRVIEAFDVSNIAGAFAVAGMVCCVDGMPHRNRYRRFRIKTVRGSDDPAMMAEVVRRRFARLAVEGGAAPDLVLVDGGRTQVQAARAALAAVGAGAVPVAGLAKRREELYREAGKPPLRLPKDSAALHVLQRLRDEAHRFAVAYHHDLRGRRIRESALDEIPGVGPRIKERLLARFGSVRRIAAAGEAEIREVDGVGPRLAAAIRGALGGGGQA